MVSSATTPAPEPTLSARPESFRAPILRGIAWKSATRVTYEVSKLVVGIVLARLLTPVEYGLAGMVLVLVAFEPVLAGVGIASVLVPRREVTEEDKSTVFWTCLAVGATASAIGIGLSWPAAYFYGEAEVQPLFAVLSLCYVISALGTTHSHLLIRQMNFKALELRWMVGALVGAVLAICFAVAGFGPWALVVQPLAWYSTSTLLLWLSTGWRPRFLYSRRSIREVRAFGGNLSGTMMLTQLNQNADNVLIGRFLGANALGAYALAYNIILVPFSRLASPLHEVLYPVFSRVLDDPPRVRRVWLRAMRLLAAVAVPAMLGLIVLAPEFVDIVFGHKWHAAVPVMQILAWVGALYVVQGLNTILLQALGRTRLLFRCSLVSFAAGLASFVIGLQWGIVGVAACFAIALTVIGPVYMTLTARAAGAAGRDVWHAISGVIYASAVAGAAAWGAKLLLEHQGASTLVRLVAAAAIGAAVYVVACRLLAREVVRELAALKRRRSAAVAG